MFRCHAVDLHGNQSCAEEFCAETHAGHFHGNQSCAEDFCAEAHTVDWCGNQSCAEEHGRASTDVQAPPTGELKDAQAQCSDVAGFWATSARLADFVAALERFGEKPWPPE